MVTFEETAERAGKEKKRNGRNEARPPGRNKMRFLIIDGLATADPRTRQVDGVDAGNAAAVSARAEDGLMRMCL